MRIIHDNRPNKISEDVFPSKKPHYGQATERRYFENPHLSLLTLYRAFQQYCFEQKNNVLKMKNNAYYRYFRENSIYLFRQLEQMFVTIVQNVNFYFKVIIKIHVSFNTYCI